MFLIVGLGNPGAEYENTPHNLGFLTVERLAEASGVRVSRRECRALVGLGRMENHKVVLAKPLSYMNLSGGPVEALLGKYELGLDDLVVICDDLNLPWTSLRIRRRGSAGGHHGLESIIGELGSREFVRVRLGVAPLHPVKDAARFLLAPFSRSQQKDLQELIGRSAEAVRFLIAEGAAKAMTKFNRRAGGSSIEEE